MKNVKEGYEISSDEFFEIATKLQKHHVLFYKFWELGMPKFVDDRHCPTAAVCFDKDGNNVDFIFGKNFWNEIDDYTREFVICHEMLHVVLNHGIRIKDSRYPQLTNVSLDLVVNHLLINKFGFNRERLGEFGKDICWVDTVFKDRETKPEDDKAFEYYYRLIKKDAEEDRKGGGKGLAGNLPRTVDDHTLLDEEAAQEIIEELNDSLSNEDKADLKDMIQNHSQDENDKDKDKDDKGGKQAGSGTGGWTFTSVNHKKVKKKKKWETIIKRWASKYIKNDFKEIEQWAHPHRRLSTFNNQSIFLPSDLDVEDFTFDDFKIDVFFFLDTSGSCYHLADRFWKAASSLPENKFTVRLFNFDTSCYETSLESKKLYGGGGTRFDIIDHKVENIIKEEKLKRYPTVFVITDGFGNSVHPKKCKNWHWFLTNDYRVYIPNECNVYMLSEFE